MDPLPGMSAKELKLQCYARALSTKGSKVELLQRLNAYEEAKEKVRTAPTPPPPQEGHRIVLKDGRTVPILVTLVPAEIGRKTCFYKARLQIEDSSIPGGWWDETATTTEEERSVWTLVRNVMQGIPITEWLAPGQKSRAELEAEIEVLRAKLAEQASEISALRAQIDAERDQNFQLQYRPSRL